jgi:hypothetical protein
MTYLDSGYTMYGFDLFPHIPVDPLLILHSRCYGAASAKDRLDCVVRDAINQGSIPGPRYLANGKEIARRGGELTPGITAYADGVYLISLAITIYSTLD